MPEPLTRPEGKILDIERLRGWAIVSVFFTHLELSAGLFRALGLDPKRVPFWLGVELFFVISGFVVTKSFTSKAMSLRTFYVRRVFRLWPTLALFFVIVTLVYPWFPAFRTGWRGLRGDFLSVLFGYYTIHNGGGSAYCGAMWSLSVEEQFYLAAPVTLLLLARIFRSWWAAACRWSAVGFFALLTAVRCVVYFGFPVGWQDHVPRVLAYLAHHRFDFLALGVLLYFQSRESSPLRRLGRTTQRRLIVAALLLPLAAVYPLGESLQSGYEAPLLYTIGWGFAGLAFYLVVGLAARDRDLLRLPRLTDRVLLYLGSRSYGIYVIHFPLVIAAWFIVRTYAVREPSSFWFGVAQAALALPVVLTLSELSFRFVERPFIRMGGRLAATIAAPKAVKPSAPDNLALRKRAG